MTTEKHPFTLHCLKFGVRMDEDSIVAFSRRTTMLKTTLAIAFVAILPVAYVTVHREEPKQAAPLPERRAGPFIGTPLNPTSPQDGWYWVGYAPDGTSPAGHIKCHAPGSYLNCYVGPTGNTYAEISKWIVAGPFPKADIDGRY